jgi:sigma-B regulation protein RsbU (phosphoserine phosphatase)
LPNAAEASFTSVANFDITSPWQESSKRRFSTAQYERPIWQMGTPERNPNREKYWAPVHFGGKDTGLLVPVGVPVYNNNEFRGVVAIETSLDYLNRINADFGYRLGTVMLVDAQGVVLAHPSLAKMALDLQTTKTLAEFLPAEVLAERPQLSDLPENQPVEVAGHVLVRHSFVSAPWTLVYSVPSQTLWYKLLQERGAAMLAMFLGLTTLIIVMYTVTAREFVVPATKLVQHLAAESQFQPVPVPKVPFPWQPWFDTISKAFRESLQLMSLRQELDIAAQMQQAILPRHWPSSGDFSLWGAMRSAKEVGGDFYDHFQLDDGKTGIVVADVSGKGVPAALFGMVSKTLLRATATQDAIEPGSVIASVNDVLCQDNESCMFVTVFYAVLDPGRGQLSYVNAGHPPPLLVHADGRTRFLPLTDGIALGVADGMLFEQQSIQLEPGDYLVIYTDGVTEAFNTCNEEFTEARLQPVLCEPAATDVQDAVHRVIRAVDAFAAGAPQSDDITCVALLYCPGNRPDQGPTSKVEVS